MKNIKITVYTEEDGFDMMFSTNKAIDMVKELKANDDAFVIFINDGSNHGYGTEITEEELNNLS